MEILMKEPAMQTLARICIPLLRRLEWPKIELPRINILAPLQWLGEAVELYRGALAAAYVTALCLNQRGEPLPDEDLEGRDPRW
jgi:hypothetical protein